MQLRWMFDRSLRHRCPTFGRTKALARPESGEVHVTAEEAGAGMAMGAKNGVRHPDRPGAGSLVDRLTPLQNRPGVRSGSHQRRRTLPMLARRRATVRDLFRPGGHDRKANGVASR
jgi:hypothetical protein